MTFMLKTALRIVANNTTGLVGCILTTSSALLFAAYLLASLAGFDGGPYFGVLVFLVNPLFFVGGLLLIPFGLWREKRKRGCSWKDVVEVPASPERKKRLLFVFAAVTAVNVLILAIASYQGVHVMETDEFCGTTCHTVMEPEYTAFLRSSHIRVGCVGCHIGPGANWWVKSKLSGSWQVIATTFDLYPRPIESPIRNLVPARETCEQCHLPTKFVGDRLKIKSRFQEDEKNTEAKTVLLVRVGGTQGSRAHGIHWHVDPAVKVRFLSDAKRETIYRVVRTDKDGTETEFVSSTPPADMKGLEWREMDCIDCHNRPTHVFRSAKNELDLAMTEGRIDLSLPFIRREGLKILKTDFGDLAWDALKRPMTEGLMGFYEKEYPQVATEKRAAIEEAGAVLADLYSKNVFPKMKVTWGTHLDHIGHEDSPGCFRCHGGDHTSKEGKTISADCENCHKLLAVEEVKPKILEDLLP